MSGNWTSLALESFLGDDQVAPWSVEREREIATPPLPVKREYAKYTLASQLDPLRSASMAVLSLNLPRRFGAELPLATSSDPTKGFPSLIVAPVWPPGLSKVATHTSPKVFFVPAGSSELSDPKKARPWLSHAITGSPELAVRMCASAA